MVLRLKRPRRDPGFSPSFWPFSSFARRWPRRPIYASTYTVTLLVTFAAYGIALLGFNILMGYTGLLSFGHAMFIAIGAYTAAVFTSELGIPYLELILLAAAAVSAAASFLIGLFCVRYTKIFFSMLTLAFGMTFSFLPE